MPAKSTKIFLGTLYGKDVYTMGSYAEDVRDIIMSQAKEIKELRARLRTSEDAEPNASLIGRVD